MIMKLKCIVCLSFKLVALSWREWEAGEVRGLTERQSSGRLGKVDPTQFRIWTFSTTSGWGRITKLHPDDWEAQVCFVFKFQVGGTIMERVRCWRSLAKSGEVRRQTKCQSSGRHQESTRPSSGFKHVLPVLVSVEWPNKIQMIKNIKCILCSSFKLVTPSWRKWAAGEVRKTTHSQRETCCLQGIYSFKIVCKLVHFH